METIHAHFDELTEMASEYNSLEPGHNRLNFPQPPSSAEESPQLTRQQMERLFAPLFCDDIDERAPGVSAVSAAQPDNIPIPDTPGTTTTVEDAPTPIDSNTTVEHTASNNDEPADDILNEVPPPSDFDPNALT